MVQEWNDIWISIEQVRHGMIDKQHSIPEYHKNSSYIQRKCVKLKKHTSLKIPTCHVTWSYHKGWHGHRGDNYLCDELDKDCREETCSRDALFLKENEAARGLLSQLSALSFGIDRCFLPLSESHYHK